jgi:hypothetical protein
MNATATKIDVTKIGAYQPLAPYHPGRVGAPKLTEADREANARAGAVARVAIEAAGFRRCNVNPVEGWYLRTAAGEILTAGVVTSSDGNREDTLGVVVSDQGGTIAEYALHHIEGTYDALPLAEKHRLSGSGGTLESWLAAFDRCGKARPR